MGGDFGASYHLAIKMRMSLQRGTGHSRSVDSALSCRAQGCRGFYSRPVDTSNVMKVNVAHIHSPLPETVGSMCQGPSANPGMSNMV